MEFFMSDIGFLDGGTGQEIYKRAGKPKSNLWSVEVLLKNPEIVSAVHKDYLRAGCRTLTLNTYTATSSRLKRAGLADLQPSIFATAKAALRIAAADTHHPVEFAGCLPPLEGSYLANPPRSFESMRDEYRKLCELQVDMDILLIETMSNSLEARAACTAARETGIPFTLGIRVETTGLTRSGETLQHLIDACIAEQPKGVWINCSSPEEIQPSFASIRRSAPDLAYGGYANGFHSIEPLAAGESVSLLAERADITPEVYSDFALSWANEGARLIGGCCEVSPAHMLNLAKQLEAQGYNLNSVSRLLL